MAINVERIADLPAKRNIDSGDNMALDNLNGGTKRYAIENLFSITGKATNAAPNYDPTATYSAGDYVVHLGDLFKANQDIDTAEDWTAAHWTAANVGDEVADLKGVFELTESYQLLLADPIPDTVQEYTFTADTVSQITHTRDASVIRTDDFTYGDTAITETRTLATGEALVIVTDLETLETTATYTASQGGI